MVGTSATATTLGRRGRPTRPGPWWLAGRLGLIVVSVWLVFRLLIDAYSAVEAAMVVGGLRLVGSAGVRRFGEQIIVDRSDGRTFVANIGPLCSSLGLVLVFAAVAILGDTGNARQRRRAFALAAGTVVMCNLLRMAATVGIGISRGPAALESFHDGLATTFAVAFISVALTLFVRSLPMFRPVPTDGVSAARSHWPRRRDRR